MFRLHAFNKQSCSPAREILSPPSPGNVYCIIPQNICYDLFPSLSCIIKLMNVRNHTLVSIPRSALTRHAAATSAAGPQVARPEFQAVAPSATTPTLLTGYTGLTTSFGASARSFQVRHSELHRGSALYLKKKV